MISKHDRKALAIFDAPQAWDRIEAGCRQIFDEIGDPSFSFSAAQVSPRNSDDLPTDSYDLVILWITQGSSFGPEIVEWLRHWAETKSSFSGGTLACFIEDNDPKEAFRFWKLLTESIAALPGLDFHWQRLWKEELSSEIVSMMSNELKRDEEFYSSSEADKRFQLSRIEQPCCESVLQF